MRNTVAFLVVFALNIAVLAGGAYFLYSGVEHIQNGDVSSGVLVAACGLYLVLSSFPRG